LSASFIGTNASTKIVAKAWGISDQTIRNKWEAILSAATSTKKIDCSEPTTSRTAQLLPASSSSSCTAQAADEHLASAFNILPDPESQPHAGTNAEETRQSATTDRNSKKRKCNDSE
jgi:hypothetical protein